MNTIKILFIFVCFLFLLLISFDLNLISSLPNGDFFTYVYQWSILSIDKSEVFNYTEGLNLKELFYFSRKLLWKTFVFFYLSLVSENRAQSINLEYLRVFVGALLLTSIIIQRPKKLIFLSIISFFTVILFKPFTFMISDWLRQSLALALYLFYIKSRISMRNLKDQSQSSLIMGILSLLMHLSFVPSLLIVESSLRSKFIYKIFKKSLIYFLVLSLLLIIFDIGNGNDLTKITLFLLSFIIITYYKEKNDNKSLITYSSIILPFVFYSNLFDTAGLTLRSFGVIVPVILIFISDIFTDFNSSYINKYQESRKILND